ncbi:MAG: PEP-CTERM sorting domain-containing protein [Planctomycetota bacterium]|nr:PEP-CTERM sorting domain-containing protein [Planctomycetota bacterium]
MARTICIVALCLLVMCSSAAQAALISSVGLDIQSRPYRALSTKLDVGSVIVESAHAAVWKASGIVPTVANGLVAWADGRAGEVTIMGFDLIAPLNIATPTRNGEFLISQFSNDWQEGNPFVGKDAVNNKRAVVYDTVQLSAADLGNIEGSNPPSAPGQVIWTAGRQLTPVLVNPTATSVSQNVVGWINYPTGAGQTNGLDNNEIWIKPTAGAVPPPAALTGATNITPNSPNRREHLAGNGNTPVWQEFRSVGAYMPWAIAAYNRGPNTTTYFDPPADPTTGQPTKNFTQPDVCGNLLVYTQEENPAAAGNNPLLLHTNIYFRDLANSSAGAIAITTQGTAEKPAISKTTTVVNGQPIDCYVVVWQDHRTDATTSSFPGGNGETDYNWDIWGQEIRFNAGTGQYALFMDPFLIRSDVGRQTNVDIDGRDVVWQSQAPGSQDIYVWGAIVPEPCTLGLVLAGAGLSVLRRRPAKNPL